LLGVIIRHRAVVFCSRGDVTSMRHVAWVFWILGSSEL
jgi:hypothetical protein